MTNDHVSLTALKNARAWVRHWQRDRECNLLPTTESLTRAEVELTVAIERFKKKETL